MTHWLEIGNLYFGPIEGDEIDQTYEDVPAGISMRRLADGSLVTRSTFAAKLRTTIRGAGVLPPGMDTIDRSSTYLLRCVGYRTISADSNTITVPGHRADVPVIYSVWNSDGVLVPWDGSSVVSGAISYRATYVPEFTAQLVDKNVSGRYRGDKWNWSLVFEEV